MSSSLSTSFDQVTRSLDRSDTGLTKGAQVTNHRIIKLKENCICFRTSFTYTVSLSTLLKHLFSFRYVFTKAPLCAALSHTPTHPHTHTHTHTKPPTQPTPRCSLIHH